MSKNFYDESIDNRNIKLTNTFEKKFIDDYIKHCIEESEDYVRSTKMLDIWEMCDLYYEGFQVPIGHTSNALQEFVNKNSYNGVLDTTSFVLQRSASNQIFVVDNRIANVIDGMIGDYIKGKKITDIQSDDNPKNNNIEKAVDRFLQQLERRKKIWENYRIPSIEGMMRLGLWWDVPIFSSRINFPHGDIRFKHYHPKDVGVDPFSIYKYFFRGRYCFRKEQVEWDNALSQLKKFKIPESEIKADDDYESADEGIETSGSYYRNTSERKFVTFYYFEYRKVYTDEKQLTDDTYLKNLEENTFEVDNMYYFESIYTKQNGCVYHGINKYADVSDHDSWQFKPVPWYNKRSSVRIYPRSDVEALRNIQDLINIGESIVLDDMRKKNMLRFLIKKELMENYPVEFSNWMKYGGHFAVDDEDMSIDDIRKVIYQWNVDDQRQKAAMEFTGMMEQKFKDQTIRSEAIQGSYPKDAMSGVAIQTLASQNKKLINYKDVNINWAATEEAKRIYRIMAEEFGSEEFVRISDKKKGDPDFIPINSITTLSGVESYFIASGMIDEEVATQLQSIQTDDLQFLEKKYTILKPYLDFFQKDNDVQIQWNRVDDFGDLKSSQAQYFEKIPVLINFLKNPEGTWYNLDIKVSIDFETERTEIENRIIAMELWKAGQMDPESAYEFLGGVFADRKDMLIKRLFEWKKTLQYAQLLEQNPQLMQIIEGVMSQGNKKQEQPKTEEKTTSQEQLK